MVNTKLFKTLEWYGRFHDLAGDRALSFLADDSKVSLDQSINSAESADGRVDTAHLLINDAIRTFGL